LNDVTILTLKNNKTVRLYSDLNRDVFDFELKMIERLINECVKSQYKQVYSITLHADRIEKENIHSIIIRMHYSLIGDD